ncbi:hypothetical protein [Prevotella sp. 10(H)]|nr:hypothetical protein [Prevotella sp. 10(H)]
MKKGVIFSIEEFAIHDGSGIRTTIFLKALPSNIAGGIFGCRTRIQESI